MTFTGDPIRILYENAAEARDVENDAFALSLAEGAAAHLDEEDELISAFSRKWNKDRLSVWPSPSCVWRSMRWSLNRIFR